MRKTKIICTLGHLATFHELNWVRNELGIPVGTLMDTKGPEIRTGILKDGPVYLEEGTEFTLLTEDIEGDATQVSISYKELPQDLGDNHRILIDDGLIELEVLEILPG